MQTLHGNLTTRMNLFFCILCGIIEGQANLTSSEGMKGAIQVTLFVGRFCIDLQVGSLFLNHSSSQIDTLVHYSRWVLYDSSFMFILYFFHWHLRMRCSHYPCSEGLHYLVTCDYSNPGRFVLLRRILPGFNTNCQMSPNILISVEKKQQHACNKNIIATSIINVYQIPITYHKTQFS